MLVHIMYTCVIPMTKKWKNVSIPVGLAGIIDRLVESQEYSSRAEFVRTAIREKLQARGLLNQEVL